MTLLKLVKLLNNAQQLTVDEAVTQNLRTFASINAGIEHPTIETINAKQKQILELLASIDSDIVSVCKDLQKQIELLEPECNQKSLEIYLEGSKFDTPEYLFDKNLQYFNSAPEENKKILLEKIKSEINWQYPAIEIHPGNGYVTKYLVACDPLYLVDTSESMFSKTKASWNEMYQRRLRYYVVNEQDTEILGNLPVNQYGFVVCTDFFDRRPLELIQKYLNEIYNKLRPGGTMFFTFNDCDYPEGIENFNNIYYCYTPGHTIIEYCNTIGYIVKGKHRFSGGTSYLEVQKPGILETIRAGQTLGKVINI